MPKYRPVVAIFTKGASGSPAVHIIGIKQRAWDLVSLPSSLQPVVNPHRHVDKLSTWRRTRSVALRIGTKRPGHANMTATKAALAQRKNSCSLGRKEQQPLLAKKKSYIYLFLEIPCVGVGEWTCHKVHPSVGLAEEHEMRFRSFIRSVGGGAFVVLRPQQIAVAQVLRKHDQQSPMRTTIVPGSLCVYVGWWSRMCDLGCKHANWRVSVTVCSLRCLSMEQVFVWDSGNYQPLYDRIGVISSC